MRTHRSRHDTLHHLDPVRMLLIRLIYKDEAVDRRQCVAQREDCRIGQHPMHPLSQALQLLRGHGARSTGPQVPHHRQQTDVGQQDG